MHVHTLRLKPGTMQFGTVKPKAPPALEDIVPLSNIREIQKRHERKPALPPRLDIRDYEDRPPEQERRPSVTEPERGVCIMSM